MYKYKYKLYKVKQVDSHTREQVQIAYMVAHYSISLHQHVSVCHVHYTHTLCCPCPAWVTTPLAAVALHHWLQASMVSLPHYRCWSEYSQACHNVLAAYVPVMYTMHNHLQYYNVSISSNVPTSKSYMPAIHCLLYDSMS